MLLSGCVRKECEEKVKDLEFTVAKEEELPEALRQQIEEKKEGAFRFTYSDNERKSCGCNRSIQRNRKSNRCKACIKRSNSCDQL